MLERPFTNDEILWGLKQDVWKGRLEKMGSERCTKRGVVEGRRPKGRFRLRLLDNFK